MRMMERDVSEEGTIRYSEEDFANLKKRVDRCKQELHEAASALKIALLADYKWHLGDILRSSNGEEAYVRNVSVIDTRIVVWAFKRKKNGSWSRTLVPTHRPDWDKAQVIGNLPDEDDGGSCDTKGPRPF